MLSTVGDCFATTISGMPRNKWLGGEILFGQADVGVTIEPGPGARSPTQGMASANAVH